MTLRSKLIRLAHANPELRHHILPMLAKHAADERVIQVQDEGAFKRAEDVADDLIDLVERATSLANNLEDMDTSSPSPSTISSTDMDKLFVALKKIDASTLAFLASKAFRLRGDVILTQKEHQALLARAKEVILESEVAWRISSKTFADNDDPTSTALWGVVNEIKSKSKLIVSLLHAAFPSVVDLNRFL